MIEIRPRENVLLATDFHRLLEWYRDVLGFNVTNLVDKGFHSCNLETKLGIKLALLQRKRWELVPKIGRRIQYFYKLKLMMFGRFLNIWSRTVRRLRAGHPLKKMMNFGLAAFRIPKTILSG